MTQLKQRKQIFIFFFVEKFLCKWSSTIDKLYFYGRKWRRTKERPNESERGDWKSWFKAQHSEN